MEKRYLEDGILLGAKLFNPNYHVESNLYVKEDELLKLFKQKFNTPEREKTIIKLGEYENNECSIPKFLIYGRERSNPFMGYGMKYYKDYKCLEAKLLSLSFKSRMIIAKKIAQLIESFEDEKLVYKDLHTGNIIVRYNNIVLVDFDSAMYESIIGQNLYKKLLGESYQNLCSLLLNIIYSIDIPGKPFECIISSNRDLFEKTANEKQKVILDGSYDDEKTDYHPSDYLDSFTEEYVEETKKKLIL